MEQIHEVRMGGAEKTLCDAINKKDVGAVAEALTRHVNLAAVNECGNTPLHFAALQGHVEIARLLLTERPPVDCQNGHGDTPLHYAANGGHVDMVALLVANAAVLNQQNVTGDTPLHEAIKRGHKKVAIQLIIDGAESEVRNNGLTQYEMAVKERLNEVVDIMEQARSRGGQRRTKAVQGVPRCDYPRRGSDADARNSRDR